MSDRLSTVISRIIGLLSRSARAVRLWGCKVLRLRVSARIATRTRCVDGEDGKLSDLQDPALRESFDSISDVIRLSNVLRIKYGLKTSIIGFKTNKPRIYILTESMPNLILIVKPHMLKSFWYKLHLGA